LTKTPVNVLYPLERPMIFNGRPYEVSDRPVQKVPSRLHRSQRSILPRAGIYSYWIRKPFE